MQCQFGVKEKNSCHDRSLAVFIILYFEEWRK